MKILPVVLFCFCAIACKGQDSLRTKTSDSVASFQLKLVPLKAVPPTSVDSIVIPEEKLVHLKIYNDGSIGYKLDYDSAYITITKDQIKSILDKYPDRNVGLKGDRDANLELFKEVIGIIQTREKKTRTYLLME